MKGYESKLQTRGIATQNDFQSKSESARHLVFKEGCGVINRAVKLIEERKGFCNKILIPLSLSYGFVYKQYVS